MPQGPRFVNPDGSLTQEAYWFLLTMLNVTQNNEAASSNPFAPPAPAPGSDPFVQALETQAAFSSGAASALASAVQSQFAAIQRQMAFIPAASNALDRIAAIERALAFRPQPSAQFAGVALVVYTQAQYATAYAAGLGGVALFIYISDYAHLIYWSGATAAFADGGNNYIAAFENDPPGPGWHLMDGSTVNYLNTDGTVTAQTLEDLTSAANNAAYLKMGSPNSGPNAAVAPTISGATETGTANIGNDTDAGVTFLAAGVGSTAALKPHTHVDAGHTHALMAADAPISATGEPRNLERRPFFRQ
jgi:hypothetical protein